jgi:hypothetical protein
MEYSSHSIELGTPDNNTIPFSNDIQDILYSIDSNTLYTIPDTKKK